MAHVSMKSKKKINTNIILKFVYYTQTNRQTHVHIILEERKFLKNENLCFNFISKIYSLIFFFGSVSCHKPNKHLFIKSFTNLN